MEKSLAGMNYFNLLPFRPEMHNIISVPRTVNDYKLI